MEKIEINECASDMNECRKRIVIVTKDGQTIKSGWFKDYTKTIPNKVNCTEKEFEVRNALLKKYNITFADIDHWCCPKERKENTLYISKHAAKRLKERNGWNKKNMERMIKKIYEQGVNIETLPANERFWVMEMCHEEPYESDTIYKMYGKFVYVFRQNTLVTVLNVPNVTKKKRRLEYEYI